MHKIIIVLVAAATALTTTVFAQGNAARSWQDVITSYLNIKNALTKNDARVAANAGKDLYDAIHKLSTEKIPGDQRKILADLNSGAGYIKSTGDIDLQRKYFVNLSANMYKIIKAGNINYADLYYQYCPMANNGRGAYWISEKQNIVNPYLGTSMPTCGSTKETIKAKSQKP